MNPSAKRAERRAIASFFIEGCLSSSKSFHESIKGRRTERSAFGRETSLLKPTSTNLPSSSFPLPVSDHGPIVIVKSQKAESPARYRVSFIHHQRGKKKQRPARRRVDLFDPPPPFLLPCPEERAILGRRLSPNTFGNYSTLRSSIWTISPQFVSSPCNTRSSSLQLHLLAHLLLPSLESSVFFSLRSKSLTLRSTRTFRIGIPQQQLSNGLSFVQQ